VILSVQHLVVHVGIVLQSSDMVECMASCHSVTIIEEKLSGDPMDVIMFVSTGWTLEEQSAESTNQVPVQQCFETPFHKFALQVKFSKYFLTSVF